jgi:hypothetical protein
MREVWEAKTKLLGAKSRLPSEKGFAAIPIAELKQIFNSSISVG